jgi:CHAT domain-containing protein/tetratricopeptide (TPR) repeat protein
MADRSGGAAYLFKQAIALVQAGRREEAQAILLEVVRHRPDAYQAWWLIAMASDDRGSERAVAAFVEFLRHAPADDIGRQLAEDEIRRAGLEIPAPVPSAGPEGDVAQFMFGNNFYTADNDAGVPFDDLLTTLSSIREAASWLDAYLVFEPHPEILSGLAAFLLRLEAAQTEDLNLAHRASVDQAMLIRVREIGALEAFAEGDQTPVDEFRRLVRAKRVIEPVLLELNGTSPAEVEVIVGRNAWIANDDDTYLLLARHAEGAGDEQRRAISWLRETLERHARPPPTTDDDPGIAADIVAELADAIDGHSDAVLGLAEAAEALIVDSDALTQSGRVALARNVAVAYTYEGTRSNDVDLLRRARRQLESAFPLVDPGSWEDMAYVVSTANTYVKEAELTGDLGLLDAATEILEAARERVGRHRSYDGSLLNVLANIRGLQGEQTGGLGRLREAVAHFDDGERTLERATQAWFVNQTGLTNTLLHIVELGDAGALERCATVIDGLLERFGTEPGVRVECEELAGRLASARYRWTGDPADLDVAIDRYWSALSWPEAPRLSGRASLLNNLCFALTRRHGVRGDPADLAAAMEAGEQALRLVPPEAHVAQLVRRNLARAHVAGGGDRAQLQRTADFFRLDARLTPVGTPDHATTLLNLAFVLLNLADTGGADSAQLLAEAEEAFQDGFASLDPATQPWDAIQIGEDVGRMFAVHEQWTAATRVFRRALDGVAMLVDRALDVESSEGAIAALDRLVQVAAYAAGRGAHPELAVTWLEQHRARGLRRALHLDSSDLTTLASRGHSDLARRYAVRAEELASVRSSPQTNDFMRRRQQLLRTQLDELADEIRTTPGFQRFRSTPEITDVYDAGSSTHLLYVAVADTAGIAFLVDGRRQEIAHRLLPDLDATTLDARGTAYLTALDTFRRDPGSASKRATWIEELAALSQWLWTVLLKPVTKEIAAGQPLTLVLAGRLALLPVSAAAQHADSSEPAARDLDLRHAPSATALLTAQEAATRPFLRSALIVSDPDADGPRHLPWAAVEAHALDRHLEQVQVLKGAAATLDDVRERMTNRGILHYACHGTAYPDRPLDSHLDLAGDERLTVGMLSSQGRLWGTRLCVLSACDSATIGATSPSEVVGIPSALIRLGVGAVIATQWPTADFTAAVFSLRFYESWLNEGRDVADAFRVTQRWLRTASLRDTAALVRRSSLPSGDNARMLAAIPASAIPFGRVEDWAAFTYTGH